MNNLRLFLCFFFGIFLLNTQVAAHEENNSSKWPDKDCEDKCTFRKCTLNPQRRQDCRGRCKPETINKKCMDKEMRNAQTPSSATSSLKKNVVMGAMGTMADQSKEFAARALDLTTKNLGDRAEEAKTKVKSVKENIKMSLTRIFRNFKAIFSITKNQIKSDIRKIKTEVQESVDQKIQEVGDNLKKIQLEVEENVDQKIQEAGNGLINRVSALEAEISETLQEANKKLEALDNELDVQN